MGEWASEAPLEVEATAATRTVAVLARIAVVRPGTACLEQMVARAMVDAVVGAAARELSCIVAAVIVVVAVVVVEASPVVAAATAADK